MATDARPLDGKTCVVTGATSGIGLATAAGLAERGARVVLVGRSPERAALAVEAIERRVPGADLAVERADLAALADVHRLAARLLARRRSLDVLVHNAGVLMLRRELTSDGFETTFAVNHLAVHALTALLLDRLRATPGARVVTVASEAHRFAGPLDFDDLQSERRYRPFVAYGRSKLANVLWTRELSRRLAGSGATANCCHPGAVATRLGRTDAAWTRVASRVIGWLLRTPEQGARASLFLASSPTLEGVSGRYFRDEHEALPARFARDDDAAARLWQASTALTGIG